MSESLMSAVNSLTSETRLDTFYEKKSSAEMQQSDWQEAISVERL